MSVVPEEEGEMDTDKVGYTVKVAVEDAEEPRLSVAIKQ